VSTVDADVEVPDVPVPANNDLELTEAREGHVGTITVRRMLPLRTRRSVGAWCFIDHYGPMDVDGMAGMNVPPHPHIGLQTVTWLLTGNVLHRDSLGFGAADPAWSAEPHDVGPRHRARRGVADRT